jgi:holo-[acyl-carrier protein] synthase
MEVVRGSGMPRFALSGVAREVMEQRRLDALLTMTHDAGVAAATVILQERP